MLQWETDWHDKKSLNVNEYFYIDDDYFVILEIYANEMATLARMWNTRMNMKVNAIKM